MEQMKINETRNGFICRMNDDSGYFKRGVIHCNERCLFLDKKNKTCQGSLRETGDCQPRFRKDHKAVYFEMIN